MSRVSTKPASGAALAILQPYVFPYLAYFQLLNAVDSFVVLDDVDFIKRGWINRNAILFRGRRQQFTIPVERPRRGVKIREVRVCDDRRAMFKLGRMIGQAYGSAPYYGEVSALIDECLAIRPGETIAETAVRCIRLVAAYLGIHTRIVNTSTRYSNCDLEAVPRLIDICRREGATTLLNPAGGRELYSKEIFKSHGIDLFFLMMKPVAYRQFSHTHFLPDLSIIDVMMFNGADKTRALLGEYELC